MPRRSDESDMSDWPVRVYVDKPRPEHVLDCRNMAPQNEGTILFRWLEACCDVDWSAWTSFEDLYASHKAWASGKRPNGATGPNEYLFSRRWLSIHLAEEYKFQRHREKGVHGFIGLRIRKPGEPMAPRPEQQADEGL